MKQRPATGGTYTRDADGFAAAPDTAPPAPETPAEEDANQTAGRRRRASRSDR